MSDLDTYDAQVRAIEAYNAPILHGFLIWLKQSGLSVETIYNHVTNIEFFTKYLVYYEPLQKLDEAKSGDVWMFLADWYPRKTLCASARSVKSYSASFKKFFKWMGETGRVSPEVVADVLSTLKDSRNEFLKAADEW
ncbi:MAG TPA: site-specific integrase [Ktedonobacteraceae bacterium]|nr:site-specific integrase [Ktedonobacteraceae bacterium]